VAQRTRDREREPRDREPVRSHATQTRRCLGLDLSGAKNSKTAVAALEYYPREKKTFLLDIFDRISGHEDQSGDAALLEVLDELASGPALIGVNVPLQLPPCIECSRKSCPLPLKCSVPAVKAMREITRKAERQPVDPELRVRDFTPYTQRPVELWIRYQLLARLPESSRFEIDEALGGNRAPLTARMHFLRRHLKEATLTEVWPKLTLATLASKLGLSRRVLQTWRHLEDGVHSRMEILEAFTEKLDVFIYERDQRKLSASLAAFDAFLCAYTALLAEQGRTIPRPAAIPASEGWIAIPRLERESASSRETE
jgi:hypothetical protein